MTPLGKEIRKHLERAGWSQRTLAINAEITHSAISKIIRGKTKPTPETVDAIGRALNVDPTHLMRLAGIPLPAEKIKRDPSVEFIAQRLDELPKKVRKQAVAAVGAQIDAIDAIYQKAAPPTIGTSGPPIDANVPAALELEQATPDIIYDEDPIQMQVANIYALVREFRRMFPKEYEQVKARL